MNNKRGFSSTIASKPKGSGKCDPSSIVPAKILKMMNWKGGRIFYETERSMNMVIMTHSEEYTKKQHDIPKDSKKEASYKVEEEMEKLRKEFPRMKKYVKQDYLQKIDDMIFYSKNKVKDRILWKIFRKYIWFRRMLEISQLSSFSLSEESFHGDKELRKMELEKSWIIGRHYPLRFFRYFRDFKKAHPKEYERFVELEKKIEERKNRNKNASMRNNKQGLSKT